MRVAQLLPALNMGGVQRGVLETSRAIVAAGGESFVISRPGELCEELIADGGRHLPMDCAGKNPLTAWRRGRRLRAILRELRPDIVHVRSRAPAWLLFFAGGGDFAVVSTFHGLYGVGFYSARMAAADRIICPSRAVWEYVAKNYRPPAEKLRLIPRGVDFSLFSPARTDEVFCAEFRRRHDLPTGAAVVAIVGRLSELKGHAMFLRAFARAKRDAAARPMVALLVGGGGDKRRERLRRLARDLGIGADVRFAGGQRRMREIYAIADVVVSASQKPEAFGRTTTEALAMSAPVVAPAAGGALDIVADGENGFLYPLADEAALAAAMTRALAREWHGLRESVAKFSLQRMTDNTLAVYREAMEARGGRRSV